MTPSGLTPQPDKWTRASPRAIGRPPRAAWEEFDGLWDQVEDGFRAASRDDYRAIEAAMRPIALALRTEDPDADLIRTEIAGLRALLAPFAGAEQG